MSCIANRGSPPLSDILFCFKSCSSKDKKKLVPVKDTSIETTLCLASAHALVLLDDGVVGDPMEKTTLDALGWKLSESRANFLL